MTRIRPAALFIVAGMLLTQSATGGMLDDFEEKGKKKEEKEPAPRLKVFDDRTSFGSGTYPSETGGRSFLESVWIWVISSPLEYRHADPSAGMLSGGVPYEVLLEQEEIEIHRPGRFVLPYVQVDYNRQYINSDLDAQDLHLELGYKALALYGRHTRYTERNPSDHLDLNQFYALLRIAGIAVGEGYAIHSWEVDIGGGVVQQRGNREYSSAAFTLPMKVKPTEWFGLEFRPAWYRPQDRTISDFDLSASLGGNYIRLRGGYRWLWMQGEGSWLNGPYAGISVSF